MAPWNAAKGSARDNIRLVVELITVFALIPTLIFTAISARAAANSARSALEQVGENKYQSVYQQQLSLWQVAVEHPTLAPVIMGGTDADAARTLAVDFYAYVYSQLALPSGLESTPRGLALDDSEAPQGIDMDEWRGWQSWSHTIAGGFRNTPGLCEHLRDNKDAYWLNFRTAVDGARVCEIEIG